VIISVALVVLRALSGKIRPQNRENVTTLTRMPPDLNLSLKTAGFQHINVHEA